MDIAGKIRKRIDTQITMLDNLSYVAKEHSLDYTRDLGLTQDLIEEIINNRLGLLFSMNVTDLAFFTKYSSIFDIEVDEYKISFFLFYEISENCGEEDELGMQDCQTCNKRFDCPKDKEGNFLEYLIIPCCSSHVKINQFYFSTDYSINILPQDLHEKILNTLGKGERINIGETIDLSD